MRRAVLALTLTCAGPALARDFVLQSPIDCDLTSICFIQQYMDRDPGPGARDYRCSGLSYDAHKGTDFALPSLAMMQRGVTVRAAAPGVVKGRRDGMPDNGFTAETAATLTGRECGNGVRIDHAGGWTTQYCHLRKGSVAVREGQQVSAGESLGMVGQSGRAAFPHLHLSVRRNGATVDPFDPNDKLSCAPPPADSTLWQDLPHYRPGGVIAAGVSDRVPEYADIKAGTADITDLNPMSAALVIWGYTFGTRADDTLRLHLTGPAGFTLVQDVRLVKPQAQAFRAIGKKRRADPWPSGRYSGTAVLIRGGRKIDEKHVELMLR